MDHLFFSISFVYEIVPASLYVDLYAEIELVDSRNCLVRNVRRVRSEESSLLPVLSLTFTGNIWVHAESGRESKIGNVIGEAIDRHLKDISEEPRWITGA